MAAAAPNWESQPYDLYSVRLLIHDYLWFSSFDSGATSNTQPVIHNYALAYALNRFERALSWSTPTYEEDLKNLNIYPTPARAQDVTQQVVTYNSVDERSHRTDADQAHNTPMMGWKRVVLPYAARGTEAVAATFSFYVFIKRETRLPRVIRIGKKRCPAVLESRHVANPRLYFGNASPEHIVNPLDVRGRLQLYVPISIPPVLLLESVSIEGDWFLQVGSGAAVHIPARVTKELSLP